MFYITTERLKLIPLTHELLKQCHENRAAMEVSPGLDVSDMQIDADYKAELKNAMECFRLLKTLKAGFVKSEMEEEIVIYTKKYTMPG